MADTPTPAPAPAPSPESTPTPRRRKRLLQRWWMRTILIVFVLLILLVALAPTIVSSGPVTGMIVSSVNGNIPGKLAIDDLSMGWFSGLRVQGVVLRDPDGNVIASIKDIDARDASITRMASSYTRPGEIRIIEPVADIVAYDDGTTNLTRALSAPTQAKPQPREETTPKPQEPTTPQFGDISMRVVVDNARLSYSAPQIQRIDVLARQLSLDVSSLHEQTVKLDATLRQGADEGVVTADIKLSELLDDSLNVHPDAAQVQATLDIKSLPVAAVDRLAGQDGRLVALIGPRLDTTLKADGPLGAVAADLTITSQHINGTMALGVSEQQLALKSGSRLGMTITPEAYAAFATGPDAPRLAAPFDVAIVVHQLAVPTLNNALQLDGAAVDAEVAIGDVVLQGHEKIGTLALRQTRLLAKSTRLRDKLTLSLDSRAEQNARGGAVTITADLTHLVRVDGSFNSLPAALVNAAITDLPLAIVDELGQLDGLAAAAAGPTLSAQVDANLRPTAADQIAGTFDVNARSEHLTVALQCSIDDTRLTATKGGHISLAMQPALFDKLAANQTLRLVQPAQIRLEIQQLDAPMKAGSPDLATMAVSTTLTVGDVVIDGGQTLGQLALRQTKATLQTPALGKSLQLSFNTQARQNERGGDISLAAHATDLIGPDGSLNTLPASTINGRIGDLPVVIVDQLGALDGLAVAAIGPILNATINGKFDPATKGGEVTVIAKAANLNATLGGTISNNVFTGAEGSRVVLMVQPAVVAKVLKPDDPAAKPALALASPATVTVDLRQLVAPLQGFDPAQVKLAATASVDQLALAGDERLANTAIRGLVIDIPATTLANPLTATIKGDLLRGSHTGQLSGSVKADSVMAPKAVNAAVTLTALPTELLDAFTAQAGKLAALLPGVIDKVDLTADATLDDKPRYVAVAKITDDQLNSDLGATYTPTGLAVRENSWASMTLTPSGFAAYNRLAAAETKAEPSQLQLTEPATLRADVRQSFIALADTGLDPARTTVDARITTPALTVRQGNAGTTYTLKDLDIAAKTTNLKDRLDLNATATIPGAKPVPGSLTSNTAITKLYNDANEFDANTVHVQTDTAATAFSVALLDALTNMQGQMIAALGDTADARVKGSFPGDMDIALKSPTADVQLAPTLTRERITGLRSPGIASLVVTQDLIRNVIGPAFPVLGDITAGNQPIKLTLDQKLNIPLQNFKLEDALVNGRLELGTLEVNRNGNVLGLIENIGSTIAAIRKRDFSSLSFKDNSKASYPVTFSPMDFKLAKGNMHTQEFWMTSPDLALGFQGGVNLLNTKLNLTMGLPGAMLASFSDDLGKYVEAAGIYEVGIKGTTAKWDAKTDKLIKQLVEGGLKQELANQVSPELSKALGGIDLGSILNTVTGKPAAKSELTWSPPPTVQAFIKTKTDAPTTGQPLTPEERQRRREQRQQQQQEPQQQTEPKSPLEQLLDQVAPKEEEPAQQGGLTPEERARRREERRREREAERQQQQQQNP